MYEILLSFTNNGGDWKKAFHDIIPQRKLPSASSPEVNNSGVEQDRCGARQTKRSSSEDGVHSSENDSTTVEIEDVVHSSENDSTIDSQTLTKSSDSLQAFNKDSACVEESLCDKECVSEANDNIVLTEHCSVDVTPANS